VRILFGSLHLERWGFDLEIIHLCDRLGLPMAVRTHHGRPGSPACARISLTPAHAVVK
jgi:hypothetical protein